MICAITDGADEDAHEAQIGDWDIRRVDPDCGQRVLVRFHVLGVKSVQEVVLQTAERACVQSLD